VDLEKGLLVINPCAGRRRGIRKLQSIVKALSGAMTLDVYETTGRLDATKKAASDGGSYDVIIACGGDGTLNEVINGVMTLPCRPQIGYIPCGSTNDFAFSVPLPLNPVSCAEGIALGGVTLLDVGSFDDRWFAYIASFGAFTESSYSTPQELKNQIGHQAYIFDGLKRLNSLNSYLMNIDADGKHYEGRFIYGSVSNTTSVGGIVRLRKNTIRLNDGKFEMLLIREPENQGQYLKIVSDILAGTFTDEHFIFTKVRDVVFRPAHPLAWTLDGECADRIKEVHVQNNCRALQLRA